MSRLLVVLIALVVLAIPINTIKTATAKDTYLTYAELQAYEEKKQEQEWSRQLQEFAKVNQGKKGGQCIVFVRQFTGTSRSQVSGMARNLRTNSKTPKIGAIVKTRESSFGHVAIQIAETETQIMVMESNYHWNQRISTRWINKNSPKIMGYLVL